jgi:hypothetical protein
VLEAHEQGFNGFTGGRAVWEQMQSDNPLPVRAGLDVGADPLTWAGGVGAWGKAFKGADAAQAGYRSLPGLGANLAGDFATGAGRVLKTPDLIGGKLWEGASATVAKPARKVLGSLLELSPQDEVVKHMDDVWSPWMEFTEGERIKAGLSPVGYGHNPLLSDEARTVLDDTFLSGTRRDVGMPQIPRVKGQPKTPDPAISYREALTFYRGEAQRIRDVLTKANISPELQGADLLNAVKSALPSEQKAVRRMVDADIDPFSGDFEMTAFDLLKQQVSKERGVKLPKRTGYDIFRSMWVEQALFSPKYLTGQLMGGYVQNLITGHAPGLNLRDIGRGVNRVYNKTGKLFDPDELRSTKLANQYGIGDASRSIFRPSGAREVIGYKHNVRSVIGEQVGGRLGGLVGDDTARRRGAKIVGAPFAATHAIAAGIDMFHRSNVWADVFESEMIRRTPTIRGMVDAAVAKRNEFLIKTGKSPIDTTGWVMPTTAEGIKKELTALGLPKNQAETLGRSFANGVNESRRLAEKALNRSQFSYLKTNLDRKIEKVWPFHYWTSRAARLYGEELIRHPLIPLNYTRAAEGIDRAQEDPGLSARQKGFLRLFGGPEGFTLFVNPVAMTHAMFSLGLTNDNFEPDGETTVGKMTRTLKQYGVGLYPWFDAAANYLGVYGDNFEPEPLGIRHRALVGSIINKAAAEGWLGIDEPNPWYAHANDALRATISKWSAMALPDWLAQPVEMDAGGPQSQITLDSIIESRIIAENPDLTNAELLDIMTDPDDPRYRSAFEDAANAGLIQQMINFTMPVQSRVKENSREARSRGLDVIRTEADRLGVAPWDLEPTMGDAQFRETFKNQTGKEFTGSTYDKLQFQQDITRSNPEAHQMILWEAEYNALGDPGTREILDKKERIASGQWVPPGYPQPRSLQEAQLLSDRWMALNGYQPVMDVYRDLRRAYRKLHPEFDQFKQWQGQVYDVLGLYGNLDEYRRLTAQKNPTFARFLELKREEIMRYAGNKTPEELTAELDRATASSEAWFAIMGMAPGAYDPAPQGAGGYFDPGPQMAPEQQFGGFQPRQEISGTGIPSGGWQSLLARYA